MPGRPRQAAPETAAPAHAQEALRVAEERFRLVMENVEDYAILVLDLDGCVVDWNEGTERLLGYRAEEILGAHVSRFFTAEDCESERAQRELIEAGATGRSADETWLVRKDGSRFWATGVVTALRDHDGTLRGYVNILRDLTARKQLEESLRHQAEALQAVDRVRDEFLAILSHQLRNPLATIHNGVQILRQADTTGPIAEQTLDMVQRQLKQVMRIIDDLLDLSRLKQGQLAAKKEALDLAAAAAQAATAFRASNRTQELELSTTLPNEPVWVEADPLRLEQMFANLLTHAARFAGAKGWIRISVERREQEAVVRIKHTGQGLSAEELPHAFDLFFHRNGGQLPGGDGLGIGLALARRLTEAHGGTLEVDSAGPDQGCEFLMRLPLLERAPATLPRPEPETLATAVRPLRILVLEDDREGARGLARLLRLWGHDVRVSHDGPTALKVAYEDLPEVALIDIGLPEMDGYEVAQQFRSRVGGAVCLIAVTGFGQQEDRQRALAAGFEQHLVKPVEPNHLRGILAEIAARKSA